MACWGATKMFQCPHHLWEQNFEQIWLQQVGFKYPHQLWMVPPLTLHSRTKYHLKVLATFLKFWTKEAKATTKVTLRTTNNNYSYHTSHKGHPTSKPLKINVEKKTSLKWYNWEENCCIKDIIIEIAHIQPAKLSWPNSWLYGTETTSTQLRKWD